MCKADLSKREKIVIVGGGGHAKVLIYLIKELDQYDIVGITDQFLKAGSQIANIPVLGNDTLLSGLFEKQIKNACIAVGSGVDDSIRTRLFLHAREIGFAIPSLIHPKASLVEGVLLAEGVQVMNGSIIQPGVSIGNNTIINTGSIVEHDCSIGNYSHIAPGAVISGNVTIGNNVFIGAGAIVIPGVTIGNKIIVGAGAVVVNDLSSGITVKGIPAK